MDGKGMMTKSHGHVLFIHMCLNNSAIVLAVPNARACMEMRMTGRKDALKNKWRER